MRFWVMLMLLSPLSAAMAVEQPGPPPWSCSVWGACNAADTCVILSTLPMKFKLTQIGDDARKYHLQGPDGYEGVALQLPSLDDAKHFAETYRSDEPAPFILVPNSRMSDTNSFWLQSMWQRGNGQRVMADEKMLVACNSIRRN
ncbi:hypothetical protein A6U87_14615 [Rhizobium sp. AC44/96]|nr:hypothetical protein A6U87_14615 [Rhizobium sp. AC44/96]